MHVINGYSIDDIKLPNHDGPLIPKTWWIIIMQSIKILSYSRIRRKGFLHVLYGLYWCSNRPNCVFIFVLEDTSVAMFTDMKSFTYNSIRKVNIYIPWNSLFDLVTWDIAHANMSYLVKYMCTIYTDFEIHILYILQVKQRCLGGSTCTVIEINCSYTWL